jgi:hypothetical protein
MLNVARGNFKEAGKDFGTAAATVFKQVVDGFNAGKDLVNGLGNGNKAVPPKFAEGTGGSGFDINKLVQNFGKETPALLHGEEAVLTKKQLTDMITGLSTKGMPTGMKMPEIKMPEVNMPGAPAAQATKLATAKREDDINRQVMEMQLASAKNGVVLDREKALGIVEEKVKKEEKAAAEQKIKEAEIKAQTDRKAMLESAIKNGPADVAEKAMKELAGITKQEQDKAKAESEIKKKETASTKGATADVKTDNKNKVSNISKTVPSEIAQQKAEEERRKAAAATAPAPKVATTTTSAPALTGKTTTLDDLNEQLKQLNKSMGDLVSHTSDVSASAEKQVRATKRLDPNVSLRG